MKGLKKLPIIIDTDPGIDDFFCIAIACAFNDLFDLRAITTIGGNNSTDVVTKNALDILKLFHREEVEVARGADSYMKKEFGDPVEKFHGKNGLGNIILESSNKKISALNATDKIYEQAKLLNGELIIVIVGPETNLALALNKFPDLNKLIKKIVIMGGTLDYGNVTKNAEANIYHDIAAAKTVFSSGMPIDMIGLNVTRKAPLKLDILKKINNNVNQNIKNIIEKLIIFRNEESMHDAIAISSLISNAIIFKDAFTYISDEGQTVVSYDSDIFNSRVAVDINIDKYYEIIIEMINKFVF